MGSRRRHYLYDVNYNRQKSVKRTARKAIAMVIVLTLIGIGYIAYDAMRLSKSNEGPSQPSDLKTQTYNIPSVTFRTNYFEFEAKPSWIFAKKESKNNKFIYRDTRSGLVRGELYVYVNQKPEVQYAQATRILPVKLGKEGQLIPGQVSDHCNKKAPGKNKVGEQVVKQQNVTFTCDNDATWYTVLIGLEGGTTSMELRRPSGPKATYTLYYHVSSADPNPADLTEVIEEFRIR